MSVKTWNLALDFVENFDCSITIGGGEPTLHKNFRDFLLDTLAAELDIPPFIITNGSTKHANLLYKLAKSEVIGCEVSQDWYHDPIDPEIVKKFRSINAIRDVTHGGTREVLPKGRAVETGLLDEVDPEDDEGQHCACETLFIDPLGNVKACGCPDAQILFSLHDEEWEEKWRTLQEETDYEIGNQCWHSIKSHPIFGEGLETVC